jgi:hypothetical protein
MEEMYKTLVRYGKIIADKNHETTEGNFIRFTTFKHNDKYYVAVKCNGVVILVAEKDDIREMIDVNK